MANFSNRNDFGAMSRNPAAPRGLQQQAARFGAAQAEAQGQPGFLQPWQPVNSMLETAQYWYSGANSEGTSNGWNTPFYESMFSQRNMWLEKANAEGRASTFYGWLDPAKNPMATGVQTWGAAPDSGEESRFGDVWQNGKKVGNVYDDFDTPTADTMMAEVTDITQDEKARIFKDPNRQTLLREVVERQRVQNEDYRTGAASQEAFQAQVERTERGIRESNGELYTTVAGAAATSALTYGAVAAASTLWAGPVSPLVGGLAAVVGGAVGGLGAYLNRDQLIEMQARSVEITDRANEQFGTPRAVLVGGQQFAGMISRYMQPISNVVQGSYDAVVGETGDGTSEFYAFKDGQRQPGSMVQIADFSATFFDSVLQFGSPMGRAAYMATMGATTVAGGGAKLSIQGEWDDRTGTFHKYENAGQVAAAAGSTFIDAAQLGTAGLLASASAKGRQVFGSATTAPTGREAAGVLNRVLPSRWRQAGDEFETLNGIRFGYTNGERVSSRWTAQALVPSEFMRWIPTGFYAKQMAKSRNGNVTLDDLYRSAHELTRLGSPFRDALIMGYAEGSEEAVQAMLDPLATGNRIEGAEVAQAAVYGAMSGAGMAAAPGMMRVSAAQREMGIAYVNQVMRDARRGVVTDYADFQKAWAGMDRRQRRDLTTATQTEQAEAAAFMGAMEEMSQIDETYVSPIGQAAGAMDLKDRFDKANARVPGLAKGQIILLGFGEEPTLTADGNVVASKRIANGAYMSGATLQEMLEANALGLETQLEGFERLERDAANALVEAQALPESTPEEKRVKQRAVDVAQARITELADDRVVIERASSVAQQLTRSLARSFELLTTSTDLTLIEATVDKINAKIQSAFRGDWTQNGALLPPEDQRVMMRAAEFKVGRHPHQDEGSLAILIPQLDMQMQAGNMHQAVRVHQGALKVAGADFDGDTAHILADVYLSTKDQFKYRSGAQYIKTTSAPLDTTSLTPAGRPVVEVKMDAPDNEVSWLTLIAREWDGPMGDRKQVVWDELSKMMVAFTDLNTTKPFIDQDLLNAALERFGVNVTSGVEKSREILLTELFSAEDQGVRMLEVGGDLGYPMALWLQTQITNAFDGIALRLARLDYTNPEYSPIVGSPQRPPMDNGYLKFKATLEAATAGSTLDMLGTNDPVRGAQTVHYDPFYTSLTQIGQLDQDAMRGPVFTELVKNYEALGSGKTRSDVDILIGRGAVERRVYYWLAGLADRRVTDQPGSLMQTMVMLAQAQVPSIEYDKDGNPQPGAPITVVQMLLNRSIQIERNANPGLDPNSDLARKLKRMEDLTTAHGDKSATAHMALVEVFGDVQLEKLIGDDASWLGPNLTLRQLMLDVAGLNQADRRDRHVAWKANPPYMATRADPPYSVERIFSGEVNGYTLLVEAMITSMAQERKRIKIDNKKSITTFTDGMVNLRSAIATYRTIHETRLRDEGKYDSDVQVFRDMLASEPMFAAETAKLIPESSRLAVFQQIGPNYHTAKWLEMVLTEKDENRAALMFYVMMKFAEFNQLGGTIQVEDRDAWEALSAEERGQLDPTTFLYRVRRGSIRSRFLQVMFDIAQDGDGIELNEFMRVIGTATSIDDLFDKINKNPAWMRGRAELLPFHDDVAAYEANPRDIWTANLPSSLLRQAITSWGKRTQQFASRMDAREKRLVKNQQLVAKMQAYVDGERSDTTGATYYALLDKLVKQRKLFPDTIGEAARDQLMAKLQDGLIRMHDKGKMDEMISVYGEPRVLMDTFGMGDGVQFEANALTAQDFFAVSSNLTKLAQGPVRIMFGDGKILTIDMSDTNFVLKMLADPRTYDFAMAVIARTTRDINDENVVGTYSDHDSPENLQQVLLDSKFIDLFNEPPAEAGRRGLVKNGHRMVGLIDAWARRRSQESADPDERRANYDPMQNLLNDALLLRETSEGGSKRDAEGRRDDVVVDVFRALRAIARVAPSERLRVAELIQDRLNARILGESAAWERQFETDEDKKMWLLFATMSRAADIAEIDERINEASANGEPPDVISALEAEKMDILSQLGVNMLTPVEVKTLEALKNSFQLHEDVMDTAVKRNILEFLSRGMRYNRVQGKGAPIQLIHKLRRAVWLDRMDLASADILTKDEWKLLSGWAIQLTTAEYTSRTSSAVGLTPLTVDDLDGGLRYYDRTGGFMLEELFNPVVLEALTHMSLEAGVWAEGSLSAEEATAELEKGLFNPTNIGEWTSLLPMAGVKFRKALLTSPVGNAISGPGLTPKELGEMVGGSWQTYRRPEASHFSRAEFDAPVDELPFEWLAGTDKYLFTKLQNHFVTNVTVEFYDGTGTLIDVPQNLTRDVGLDSFNQTGEFGLFALELGRLNAAIKDLASTPTFAGAKAYKVVTDYVDVDKQPYTGDWANNIFFEGIGRSGVIGAAPSAIAALWFGLDGLSKTGQQNPLDMAAKKGNPFRSILTTPLDEVLALEAETDLSKMLIDKAWHMIGLDYETGKLQSTDLPALHKLMRMRHVVAAMRPDGTVTRMMVDEVIQLQKTPNPADPTQSMFEAEFSTMQLIPLSDAVAQAIWGGAAFTGTFGLMQRPEFNIQDLSRMPDVSDAGLERLGLLSLGENADIWNSPLVTVGAQSKAINTEGRGKDVVNRYEMRARVFRQHAHDVWAWRQQHVQPPEQRAQFKRSAQQMRRIFQPAMVSRVLTQIGVPNADLLDAGQMEDALRLAMKGQSLLANSQSTIWTYQHGGRGNLQEGVLVEADLENMDKTGRNGVAFGDVVVIDLANIEAASADIENAEDLAFRIIKQFMDRGVMIAFGSAAGNPLLASAIMEQIETGRFGYRRVEGNAFFWEPITSGVDLDQNLAALNAMPDAIPRYARKNVELNLAVGDMAGLNENLTYVDAAHTRIWRRMAHTILPSTMQARDAAGSYLFNVPAPSQVQAMVDKLLPLLEDPTFVAHFLGLSENKEPASRVTSPPTGNPKGVRVKQEYKIDGQYAPGVLDGQKALEELKEDLKNNLSRIRVGATLQTGTIIPFVDNAGNIFLYRMGYEFPTTQRLRDQLHTAVGRNAPEVGEIGLGIGISEAKLDPNHTVPVEMEVTRVQEDVRGLQIVGEYTADSFGKVIFVGTGFKNGLAPLPDAVRLGIPLGSNGTRVTTLTSEQGIQGKQAWHGMVNNMSTAFAVSGWDFRTMLINQILGEYPADEADFQRQWGNLKNMLDMWSKRNWGITGSDISTVMDSESELVKLIAEFNNQMRQYSDNLGLSYTDIEVPDLVADPSLEDPAQRMTILILLTLMVPGITTLDIVSGHGLLSTDSVESDQIVSELPRRFTDHLLNPAYPKTAEYAIGLANARFEVDPITNEPLHYFDHRLRFFTTIQQRQTDGAWVNVLKEGDLQIVQPMLAEANLMTAAQAAMTAGGAHSPHIARTDSAAFGARTFPKKPRTIKGKTDKQADRIELPDAMDELFGQNTVVRFGSAGQGTLFDMLQRTDSSAPYNPFEHPNHLQAEKLNRGEEEVRVYMRVIPRDGWTQDQMIRGGDAARAFLKAMGVDFGAQQDNVLVQVDYLVRQYLGHPAVREGQQDYKDVISYQDYIQAISNMTENVKDFRNPLLGGEVPLPHVLFWKMVYEANMRQPGQGWAPAYEVNGTNIALAHTWEEWGEALMGQTLDSDEPFEPIYLDALDGFFHTYQGASRRFDTLPYSTSAEANMRLLSKDATEYLYSLDPGQNAVLSDPIVLNAVKVTYEALMGGDQLLHPRTLQDERYLSEQEGRSRWQRWRRKREMAQVDPVSLRQFGKNGAQMIEQSKTTNNLLANATNASLTTRLFNPSLYVSALLEVPFRQALEILTDVATGQAVGRTGKLFTGLSGKNGLTAAYTQEEQQQILFSARQLGQSNRWLGELFDEMIFTNYVEKGRGKVGQFLETTAARVARMTQDPTWNMRSQNAGIRYLSAVVEHMHATNSDITIQQLTDMLKRDPLWVKKNDPIAHRFGVNRVAQVRATRQTAFGKGLMSGVDAGVVSTNTAINFGAHMAKLPLMFTRFNVNALLTITGLNAIDQVVAMTVDGRQRPALINRLGALARQEPYDPNEVRRFDMSDVVQGLDLSRAFVTGGITQTGLLLTGMMASGIGLDGEDDETKRRRKMAQYLGVQWNRDPRQAANDWRQVDGVYLDNVPLLGALFKNASGNSVVSPHWILRQFLSPVLGTMRFLETGDPLELRAGFVDAIGVVPTSVLRAVRETTATVDLILQEANDVQTTSEQGATTAWRKDDQQLNTLLLTALGIYEKAVFENAFFSALYVASDEYDRDPWVIPKTADENTGELDRTQGTDLPQPTDALQSYVTDEGTVGEAYVGRDVNSALLRGYAENNLSAAVILSILNQESFFRKDMAIKTREAEVAPTSKAEVEALVLSAFMGMTEQKPYTEREIRSALEKDYEDANVWWDAAKLDAEAKALFEQQGAWEMTLLDDAGREVIGKDAARGLYSSLRAGLINFDDPQVRGFNVPREMREEIAEEWVEELVQEGINAGLKDDAAKWRAKRIWNGDWETGNSLGLRDLLFSDRIGDGDPIEYNQLNVTYITGPDGRPWATPFTKQTVLAAIGIPVPAEMPNPGTGTALDKRGNVVDLVTGINTGLNAVVRQQLPEKEEEDNNAALDRALAKNYQPDTGNSYRRRGGWRNFGRRRGGGGYGGGGYSGGGGYFQRMNPLPDGSGARTGDIPMINVNTPYVRRAIVREERISSERGRLKPWQ